MSQQPIHPFTIDQLPGRTIRHGDQDYLFFSGTAYLGMPQHPGFQQLLTSAIGRYGTAFGSSRNGNLQLGIYDEAEARLASWSGAEAALTVSSGMMAGQVVVQYLRAQQASFLYGPQAHPALWHDPAVALPGLPFSDWVAQLPDQVRALPPGPVAILLNALDAAHSGYYPFDWVDALPTDRAITLVVDDSHGIGILNDLPRADGLLGPGWGIWPQIPRLDSVRLLVTASLAKAMGVPGGVVLGDADVLAELRKTAFFGACSPMPPAYMDVLTRADALYAEQRAILRENITLAEALLDRTGLFQHARGLPVFFTEQNELYPFLLERGMFIYSFAYPTPADHPNTRVIISAFHTFDDIQALARAVYDFTLGSGIE
ncbi:aminotransferase class I/II-fold pyridoxal phosphate-dependent enzyme [Spirosoma sp. 209]|uniref:aminotransferase class I/II-fold pyridoxal phosphate-dependent enzyme n=1 Tax=Spirosoma sp. 209 TaxID=1955701 RepID=UPI001F00738C|nr:aminotransferase class I/II-fold pyridoxal phosphate-dependent enzyme [Spirosoma sp. 209]